jgi:nicotinamidase-related amidase
MTSNALIVIDVQEGFHDPFWGERNNPQRETNVELLLQAWREQGLPIVLVRHDSTSGTSPLRPEQPGNDFMPFVQGTHSLLITKSVNSAFYGNPNLDGWLREQGITEVTICGITTNHCCETTARMAGNLGYDVTFVIDATATFARTNSLGRVFSGEELSAVTAVNLDGEFATVRTTHDVLTSLSAPQAN